MHIHPFSSIVRVEMIEGKGRFSVARPGGRSTGPIVGPVVISSVEEGNVAERSYGVQTSRGWRRGARFFSEIDRKRSGQFTLGVWRHDSLRSIVTELTWRRP